MRPLNPAAQQAYYALCQAMGWDPNCAGTQNTEDVYRPVMDSQDLGTPETHGSNIDPNADFPINTDDYDISDMEPTTDLAIMSPPEVATGSRTKGKGKAKEELHPVGQKRYTLEETVALAKCYVNQQRVNRFWMQITEKYNEMKPDWGKERPWDNLLKHWSRVQQDVSKFAAIYHNTQKTWGSSQSLDDILQRAMKTY